MDKQQFDDLVKHYRQAKPKLFVLATSDPLSTREDIRRAEGELNCRLNDKYRDFIGAYGGGDFGLALIYTCRQQSEWDIVAKNKEAADLIGPGYVAFSDNEAGDYYLFRCQGGMALDDVWWWDHETGDIVKTDYADVFEFLAKSAFEAA